MTLRVTLVACAMAFAAAFTFVVAGCQKASPPSITTHAVHGTVLFKSGEPLTGGTIQFMSAVDQTLTMSSAIGSDGSFEIKTVHENQNLTGAIEGPCQVMVMYFVPGSPIPQIVTLPTPYEVSAKDNEFDIQLPTMPPK